MDTSERFEQLIAFLGSQLPSPVEQMPMADGSIVFTGGSPAEVVAHLTETSVVIGEYAGAWDASDFVVKPRRVGVVKWRRLPETAMISAISALLKGAREMRLTRYRPCTSCGQKNPPEWLAEDDVCPHCAAHESDVVH